MTAPTHILYHAHCMDGFGAALVAWMVFGGSAEYHPVSYGEPLPKILDGADVYILDFSFPREALTALAARCRVVVLDHHATAEADLRGLEFAKFESDKSGAVMAWEYFRNHFPDAIFGAVPKLLLYVQDRDLWRWELHESRAVSAGLYSRERSFKEWSFLAGCGPSGIDALAHEGKIVLRVNEAQVNSIAARARAVPWLDTAGTAHAIPVANTPVLQSEVCHELLQRHPCAFFAAAYFDQPGLDETTIERVWSLRGRGDIDVSQIAKAHGGGGHRNAAGFTTLLPANDVLVATPGHRPPFTVSPQFATP